MKHLSKRLFILFFSILVLLCIGFYFSLKFDSKPIYPFNKDLSIQIGISHESVDSSWSIGKYSIDNNQVLRFNYKLSNQSQEPFAGLYLYHKDTTRFFDFTDYNTISFHLKSKNAKRIPVFLTVNYPGKRF